VINFISNLPEGLRSGGFSAMNAAACAALRRRCDVAYIGPIDPPVGALDKGVSKALRVSGLAGDFPAFSARRLAEIAREAAQRARPEAELAFFHGFTPWIATHPARPYVAWSDCDFDDYIEVFHDRSRFRAADLARISEAEGVWLRGARRVLFTSEWAAARAARRHRLDPARVGVVGIFGEIAPPERDAYDGRPRFAFVSTDFAAKGGAVVLAAFERLQAAHPEAELVIVGAPPTGPLPARASYAGYLRKERPDEAARLTEILANSAAVVHPTRGDIAPLLLVEAAMVGCPAIASRRFAIPELVSDGETGWLLDRPEDAGEVAAAMARMLDDPAATRRMRTAAWAKARASHTKDRFETRLLAFVEAALDESATVAA
jgi:glycosyltransferase involved in cell wall biosynthesis